MKDLASGIEVHESQPNDFKCHIQIAACYIEIEGKLLLLQRANRLSEEKKWGVPAGKLEMNESPEECAFRELFEETGIKLDPREKLQSLGALYLRRPDMDYVYHMFKIKMDTVPDIFLSNEHLNYQWVTRNEITNLPLMAGAEQALKIYSQRSPKKVRIGSSVNVYLILRQKNEILFSIRKNTGYYDDFYGLVSGHVETGESATSAIIRESFEEVGITITASELKIIHVLHRQTDRQNVDIFFECSRWKGQIENREPEKCAALEFYRENELPLTIIPCIKEVLNEVKKGSFYSENGWK